MGDTQDVSLWERDAVQSEPHLVSVALLDPATAFPVSQSAQPVAVASVGTSITPLHALGGGGGGTARFTSMMDSARAVEGKDVAGLSALVTRVELTEEGSSTLLRLCSLVQVINATQVTLDIAMKRPGRASQGAEHALSGAAGQAFTADAPYALEVGGSVSVPVVKLDQGLQVRPNPDAAGGGNGSGGESERHRPRRGVGGGGGSTPGSPSGRSPVVAGGGDGIARVFRWAERDSVLWPTKLLEMEATLRQKRQWEAVRTQCNLSDSEYLIYSFACLLKWQDNRRPRSGQLYLTSAHLCFVYKRRYRLSPLVVPCADLASLEVDTKGHAILQLAGEDDAADGAPQLQAELRPPARRTGYARCACSSATCARRRRR